MSDLRLDSLSLGLGAEGLSQRIIAPVGLGRAESLNRCATIIRG